MTHRLITKVALCGLCHDPERRYLWPCVTHKVDHCKPCWLDWCSGVEAQGRLA